MPEKKLHLYTIEEYLLLEDRADIGLDKSIYLNTLDCHLKMSDLYRNAQGLVAPPFDLNR